jgi:hypothetical protein
VKWYVASVIGAMKTGDMNDDDIRVESWALGIMAAALRPKKRAALVGDLAAVFSKYSDRRRQDEYTAMTTASIPLHEAFVDAPFVKSAPSIQRSSFVGV